MRAARLEIEAAPVVLTGANGAGKTNLLEAVSFLAPGRGLRRARLGEIDRACRRRGRQPPGAWAIAARLADRRQARCRSAPAATPPAIAASGASSASTARAKSQAALAGVVAYRLADAADGPAVHRGQRRAAALPRPAGAGLRCRRTRPRLGAYEQAMRERARLLREGAGRSGLARRARGAHGGATASRSPRRGARWRRGSTPPAPRPRGRSRRRGSRSPARSRRRLARCRRSPPRTRCAAASKPARRVDAESGVTAAGPHRSDLRGRA